MVKDCDDIDRRIREKELEIARNQEELRLLIKIKEKRQEALKLEQQMTSLQHKNLNQTIAIKQEQEKSPSLTKKESFYIGDVICSTEMCSTKKKQSREHFKSDYTGVFGYRYTLDAPITWCVKRRGHFKTFKNELDAARWSEAIARRKETLPISVKIEKDS